MLLALSSGQVARSEIPAMPSVVSVPPSAQPPLSSAERAGTEYADLVKAGYVEEEYYLSGIAPATTAADEILFQAPYTTRILIRKPMDPARFNGTVVIDPFTCLESEVPTGF
ncbi:MAG: alpha/beta hydrolase domain-containing protein [Pseudomonadota bacterium]